MKPVYKTIDLPNVHLSQADRDRIRNISVRLFAVYYVPGKVQKTDRFSYHPAYYGIGAYNSFAPEVDVGIEENSYGTKLTLECRLVQSVFDLVLRVVAILMIVSLLLAGAKAILFPQTVGTSHVDLIGILVPGGIALFIFALPALGLLISSDRFAGKYQREVYKCLRANARHNTQKRKK